MKITIEAKKFFFDRERVLKAVDAGRRQALGHIGGFTRKTAMRSIRRSSRTSRPGRPPNAHEDRLKKNIWYAYDPRHESVVIGPVQFRSSIVPQTLEHGGTIRVTNKLLNVQRLRGGKPPKWVRYTGPLTIRARPFMGPALEKTKSEIPERFEGLIRR